MQSKQKYYFYLTALLGILFFLIGSAPLFSQKIVLDSIPEEDSMLDTTSFLTMVIAILIAGLAGFLIYLQRKNQTADKAVTAQNSGLQLQAYERLILLTNRIALPNLISRLNVPGASARDMQELLTRNIREEFEYNISQQIYVSPAAWNALKNLQEQNLLIVNQVAQQMEHTATSTDLNRNILTFLMNDQRGKLHELVGEILSYEAKKCL